MEISVETLWWLLDGTLLVTVLALLGLFLRKSWRTYLRSYLDRKLESVAHKEDLREIAEIAEKVEILKTRETMRLDARSEVLLGFYDAVAEFIYGLLSGPTVGVPLDYKTRDPTVTSAEFGTAVGMAQAKIVIAHQRLHLFFTGTTPLVEAASTLLAGVLEVGKMVGERMSDFERARWAVDVRKEVLEQLRSEGGVTEAFAKGTIEAVDQANTEGRELMSAIQAAMPQINEQLDAFNEQFRSYLREEKGLSIAER